MIYPLNITRDFMAHKAETVQQEGGVHGLEYEEGIWTPSLSGGTHTYSTRDGGYVRIGKKVYVWFNIILTAKGDGNVHLGIYGLPFIPHSFTGVASLDFTGIAIPDGYTSFAIKPVSGGLYAYSIGNNTFLTALKTYSLLNNTTLNGAIEYLIS